MSGQQLAIDPDSAQVVGTDEQGRPIIVVREQGRKTRLHGIPAVKVSLTKSLAPTGANANDSTSLTKKLLVHGTRIIF